MATESGRGIDTASIAAIVFVSGRGTDQEKVNATVIVTMTATVIVTVTMIVRERGGLIVKKGIGCATTIVIAMVAEKEECTRGTTGDAGMMIVEAIADLDMTAEMVTGVDTMTVT